MWMVKLSMEHQLHFPCKAGDLLERLLFTPVFANQDEINLGKPPSAFQPAFRHTSCHLPAERFSTTELSLIPNLFETRR